MALNRIERRRRIHYRIRKHVNGTAERPRMVVFRSNKQIYVQVINDLEGKTLVAAASNDKALAAEPRPTTRPSPPRPRVRTASTPPPSSARRSPSAPSPRVSPRSLSTAEAISSMAELKVWPMLPVKAASYSNQKRLWQIRTLKESRRLTLN